MQRGRTKRCQVPIRTRRRQSDAKWRASVATCYETLKFIIPNGRTLPKRKASKETEKHIGSLERALSRLLNIEAQEQGQGVLWKKEDNWAPATLHDFQKDFARQQGSIFQQASQGRRCYNMLHDIQEDIIGLSVDCNSLAFVPLGASDEPSKATREAATCTRRHRLSKARCRYETEKASQRILSAYTSGDVVEATIPATSASHTSTSTCTSHDADQLQAVPTSTCTSHDADQLQAVPTTPGSAAGVSAPVSSGNTTIRLHKWGNGFVSGDKMYLNDGSNEEFSFHDLPGPEQVVVKNAVECTQVQSAHEVPVMTPHKMYGIAHHDVMMSQDGAVQDLFSSTQSHLSGPPPAPASILIKQEVNDDSSFPYFSGVRKKLDFNASTPERLFENSGGSLTMVDNTPYISSVVSLSSSGFTPLKSQVTYTAGLTPVKTEPRTPTGSSHTFTPMKMTSDLCMTDTALFSPNSAWALGSAMDARVPQAVLSDLEELADIDGDGTLLCTETFDLDTGFSDPSLNKTPQTLPSPTETGHFCKKRSVCKKRCKASGHGHVCHRSRPKCRKRLEGLYEKTSTEGKEETGRSPVVTGIFDSSADFADFDGYLLYYQQVAPGLKKKLGRWHDENSLAAMVSDMWSQLPNEDRSTMVTLAALENQDSRSSGSGSLSQDLEELNVTPIADRELVC